MHANADHQPRQRVDLDLAPTTGHSWLFGRIHIEYVPRYLLNVCGWAQVVCAHFFVVAHQSRVAVPDRSPPDYPL